MKTDSFTASRILLPLWLALLAPVAWGQTFYSPGGVGIVATETRKNAVDLSADIFAWDINSNTTSPSDTYIGEANSSLTITTGEFRVVLGPTVDLNNTFWNTTQTWTNILTSAGNGGLPTLTNGTVLAYTYSNPNFTLVNTSARGSFSLSGSSATSYSVTWTAIPEPSSALAGMLLVGGLLRRRR